MPEPTRDGRNVHAAFDADGCLKEGPVKGLVEVLAHSFAGWVETILRSRALLVEDSAHAAQSKAAEPALVKG